MVYAAPPLRAVPLRLEIADVAGFAADAELLAARGGLCGGEGIPCRLFVGKYFLRERVIYGHLPSSPQEHQSTPPAPVVE